MNPKKKILLVSAISPIPKNSGGSNRIYNEIVELSKKYEIHLITIINQQLNRRQLAFFNKYCKSYSFIQLKEKSLSDFFSFGIPYWFSDYHSEDLILLLNKKINLNPDIIQVEFTQFLFLFDYISKFKTTIFVSHDVSSLSFFRRAKEEKKLYRKILYYLLAFEVYMFEKKYLEKANLVVAMSKNDKKLLTKLFKISNIEIVKNGYEQHLKKTKKKKHSKILKLGYIGSFSHSPNKTAVKYFFNMIAPILRNKKLNFSFYLAGDNTCENLHNLKNNPEFINLGFVQNLNDFYSNIDLLVAPIQSGSGTRIKIIEAVSFGVPVVTSKIGAEGIESQPLIKICSNANEYVKAIEDKIFISQTNKQIIAQSWKEIFSKYMKFLETFK